MSQDLTDMVWDAAGIRSTPRLVLLRLARHANPDGGSIFPSVASLCDATALTPPTVRAALMELQNIGVLALVAMEDPVTHRPREYRIVLECLAALRATPANPLPLSPAKDLPHPRKELAPTTASDLRGGGKILSFPPQGICPIPANPLPPTPASDFPHPRKEFSPSPQNACPIPAKDLPHPRKEFAPTLELKERAELAQLVNLEGEEGALRAELIVDVFDEARVTVFGAGVRRPRPAAADADFAASWIEMCLDLPQVALLPLCQQAFLDAQHRQQKIGAEPIGTLRWFDNRIRERIAAAATAFPAVSANGSGGVVLSVAPQAAGPEPKFGRQAPATRTVWRMRLVGWRDKGLWMPTWGPNPSESDCEAPADLIAEILPQPELL